MESPFAGGLPIGIIAVDKKIDRKIKSKKLNIFFGGTFSGNSIIMYVANSITNYLFKNKNIRLDLEKKTDKFKLELNTFINKNNIDARVIVILQWQELFFQKKNIYNRTQRDFFEKNNKKIIDKFSKYMWKKEYIFLGME